MGAPDGFGTYFLAPELGRLAEQHPNLTLQLVALPRIFSLSKREADIAVTLEQPTEGRLVSRKLTDYRLRLYASQDYLDRHGTVSDPSGLAGRLFVTYVRDLVYSPVLDYFGSLERHGPRRYEVASVVAQLEAVRAGIGIGILHDYAARLHPELQLVLPAISFVRAYWLVDACGGPHPPAHRGGSRLHHGAGAGAARDLRVTGGERAAPFSYAAPDPLCGKML